MASIEITEENPINVSLGEENTLVSSVSSPESVSVTSTDGWYEKKYEEIDPIFEKSPASDITNEDIENWNNKSDFSGDYNDLENKPELFSGDYDDLENKPTIPTKTSDLTNDSGFLTEHQDISGKVDKVTGKGLSSNDFTNTYKSNIDSNTSARHTHSNKSVLDDISSSDVSNWDSKQESLVSGTNIKTINNQSILGSGNITIQGGGGSGDGDMLKSVYDTNDNGIVDNAEKVNNHTVGTDVPSNAVFTDTVYDDTSIRQELNDKADSSDIPTKTSDLTNDSGFITDFGNSKTYYGTSDTGASTSAKVVTSSDFVLETGATIFVKFTNANTYNGTATLNINGTGAKDIASVGTTKTTRYYWTAGEVVGFVYDGTNFVMLEKGTATTTYYGLTKLSSSTTSTSEALSATPKAVKTAYDLANSKQDAITSSNKLDYSLIDNTPTIPTKTSDLTNDSGFLTQHQDISGKVDKVDGKGLSTNDFTNEYKSNVDSNTSARHTHSNKSVLDDISSTDVTNWDNKSDFSGDYDDLVHKPTIPTHTSQLTNDSSYMVSEKTFESNQFKLRKYSYNNYTSNDDCTNKDTYLTITDYEKLYNYILSGDNEYINHVDFDYIGAEYLKTYGFTYKIVNNLPSSSESRTVYAIKETGSIFDTTEIYCYRNGSFEQVYSLLGTDDYSLHQFLNCQSLYGNVWKNYVDTNFPQYSEYVYAKQSSDIKQLYINNKNNLSDYVPISISELSNIGITLSLPDFSSLQLPDMVTESELTDGFDICYGELTNYTKKNSFSYFSTHFSRLINATREENKIFDLNNAKLNFKRLATIKYSYFSDIDSGDIVDVLVSDSTHKIYLTKKNIGNYGLCGCICYIDGSSSGNVFVIDSDNTIITTNYSLQLSNSFGNANYILLNFLHKTFSNIITYGDTSFYSVSETDELLLSKQDTLVSGTNIKTINGNSILGSGDLEISGSGLFYQSGDTFKILNNQDALVLSGYVSGGQKTLAFAIPTDKSMENITSITANTLKANVRATNGYIFASGYTEGGYNLLSGTSNVQIFKMTNNLIGVQIAYTNNISNSTNNSTVSVSLRDFKFTFS